MPQRRQIRYTSVDDVIADVEELRGAKCDRCGKWSLPQACWHLNQSLTFAMKGIKSPNTPEQDAKRARLEVVLASEQLPSGTPAPPQIEPAFDVPERAVDEFLASLRAFAKHPGPFSTHRLFGNMTDDELRRLALIHMAHHLSHFVTRTNA